MAQVIDAKGIEVDRKNSTVSATTSKSGSKTTSSKNNTSSSKNTEEYDFEQEKLKQEEIKKRQEEERQELLREKKKKAYEKTQKAQVKKYKEEANELQQELQNISLIFESFQQQVISSGELGILSEGKITETDEYGNTIVKLMSPTEYYFYLSNQSSDLNYVNNKYAEYSAKYEEMFHNITYKYYGEITDRVIEIQNRLTILQPYILMYDTDNYAEQVEKYLNMVNEILSKYQMQLDELTKKYTDFTMCNGVTLDREKFALYYLYNGGSPEYVKENFDIEWLRKFAVENGYDTKYLNPMYEEEYQKILKAFSKYIDEVYKPLYENAFHLNVGITVEQYNQKVEFLNTEIMKYSSMAYDLRQQKKQIPYLRIADTEEYKNYNYDTSKMTIDVKFDQNTDTYKVDVYIDGKLVKDKKTINTVELSRLLGDNGYSWGVSEDCTLYKYLDETETKMYNYLFETQGKEAADDYLEAIKDSINKKKGLAEADKVIAAMSNEEGQIRDDFGSWILSLFNGFGSGSEGFVEGLENVWGADGVMTDNQYFQTYLLQALNDLDGRYIQIVADKIKASAGEEESKYFLENIYDDKGNIKWNSDVAKKYLNDKDKEMIVDYQNSILSGTFEFGMTAGNMAPAQLLACVSNLVAPGSGEWVASAAIGLSSMGNNTNQKLIEGSDKLKAYVYGALTGTSEALLEKMLGNIGFLHEGASFSLKGILSEVTGELMQMGVETYLNDVMYGVPIDANALLDEGLKTILYTALLSGVSTGGQLALNLTMNGKKANITNFSSFCDFVGMMNSGEISFVKNENGSFTCVLNSDSDVTASKLAEIESMFPGVPIMQKVSDGMTLVYDSVGTDSKSIDAAFDNDIDLPGATAILTKPGKSKVDSNNVSNKTDNSKKPTTVEQSTKTDNTVTESSSNISNTDSAIDSSPSVINGEMDGFNSSTESITDELGKVDYGKSNPITYAVEFLKSNLRKYLYTDTSKVAGLNEQIMSNGLYHFTSAADAILDSGHIRASGMNASYGNPKTFFFNGVPEVGAFATNLDSIPLTATAVKVDATEALVNDPKLKVRYSDDLAITYDGKFNLDGYNAEKCFFVLVVEDGKLVYKQVSESVYNSYASTNMGKAVSEYVSDKSNVTAIKNDFLSGISLRNTGGNVVDSSDVLVDDSSYVVAGKEMDNGVFEEITSNLGETIPNASSNDGTDVNKLEFKTVQDIAEYFGDSKLFLLSKVISKNVNKEISLSITELSQIKNGIYYNNMETINNVIRYLNETELQQYNALLSNDNNSIQYNWVNSLSDVEKMAIRNYAELFAGIDADDAMEIYGYDSQGEIVTICDLMRLGLSDGSPNIDSAIEKFGVLPNEIVTYRGVGIDALVSQFGSVDLNNLDSLIGKVYTDKAYMSSSLLESKAKAALGKKTDVVMKITVPTDANYGAYIESLSNLNYGQLEFLIKKNSSSVIENAYLDENGILVVEMKLFTPDNSLDNAKKFDDNATVELTPTISSVDDFTENQIKKINYRDFLDTLYEGKLKELGFPLDFITIGTNKFSLNALFELLFDNTLASSFYGSCCNAEQHFSNYKNEDVLSALQVCVKMLQNMNYEIDFTDTYTGMNNMSVLMKMFFNNNDSAYEISVKEQLYSPADGWSKIYNISAANQHSIINAMNSGDIELQQKLEQMVKDAYMGISTEDAIKFLRSIDSDQGVCNYANVCNAIFELFYGKEDQFEQKFGFPMYYNGNLNDAQLLLDMFLCITGNSRMNFENGHWFFNDTEDYLNLSAGVGESYAYEKYLIENYLKMMGLFDENTVISEKQLFNNYNQSNMFVDSRHEDILKKVNQSLKNGEHVSISSVQGILMKELGSDKFSVLKGAHIMSVYGIDNNGNLLVDSWGKKYVIYLKDALNRGITFNIDSLDIRLSDTLNNNDYVDNKSQFNTVSLYDIPNFSTEELVSYLHMLNGDIDALKSCISLLSDEQLINLLNFIKIDNGSKFIYNDVISSLSINQFLTAMQNDLILFSNGQTNRNYYFDNGSSLTITSLLSIIADKQLFNGFVNAIKNNLNGQDYFIGFSNTDVLIAFSKLLEEFTAMKFTNAFDGAITELSDLVMKIPEILNSKEYDSNRTITLENANIINSKEYVGDNKGTSNIVYDVTSDIALSDANKQNIVDLKFEIVNLIDNLKRYGMTGELEKARAVYVELCKQLSYFPYDTNVANPEFALKIDKNYLTNADRNVRCYTWAALFKESLMAVGFPAENIKIINHNEDEHHYVCLKINNSYYIADATFNYDTFDYEMDYKTIDLVNVKIGRKTKGFFETSYGEKIFNGIDTSHKKAFFNRNKETDNIMQQIDGKIGIIENNKYEKMQILNALLKSISSDDNVDLPNDYLSSRVIDALNIPYINANDTFAIYSLISAKNSKVKFATFGSTLDNVNVKYVVLSCLYDDGTIKYYIKEDFGTFSEIQNIQEIVNEFSLQIEIGAVY